MCLAFSDQGTFSLQKETEPGFLLPKDWNKFTVTDLFRNRFVIFFKPIHLTGSGGTMFVLDVLEPLLGVKVTLPAELNSPPTSMTSKLWQVGGCRKRDFFF